MAVPATSTESRSVPTDAELVQRCLTGDEPAMRALIERYQHMAYSLSLRMMMNADDAEDIVQESFLRVFRSLDSWDQQRPMRPWLLTIVANRCRTALERRKRQPIGSELATELAAERREHSKHRQEELDLAEELERALAELRDDHRACFVMYHQQEMSYQEIGEVLDCPQGTIKTWLHRARAQLAAILTERGVILETPS